MNSRLIALLFVLQLAICSTGCLSQVPASPEQQTTLLPALPSPEITRQTLAPGDMALQLTDVPADYLLKDRTVIAYSEVSQLARDLGWQQGYRATFFRMNREKDDITGISQSISVYPIENIGKVYDIETEGILSGETYPTRHEIPFPKIGDESIAFRETRPADPLDIAIYTIIFKKKNVFETISMAGTTTDYEILKDVARKAADKIQ
ncbi:MAG: hypothetical protein WCH85_09300 [Methanomicrobiales archaeon]